MVKGEAEGHELNRRDETLALSSLAKSIIALVRKTYDNLFRFFSAPHGARSLPQGGLKCFHKPCD